jgi:bifunctional non-homologous end joining protein LigD
MKAGKLIIRLHGEKLAGLWELVRISGPEDRQDQWIAVGSTIAVRLGPDQ